MPTRAKRRPQDLKLGKNLTSELDEPLLLDLAESMNHAANDECEIDRWIDDGGSVRLGLE